MKRKQFTSSVAILFALVFALGLPVVATADDDDKETAEEKKEAPAEAKPIEADQYDEIKKHLKKAVIVHGTIGEVKVFKTSGHTLVKFKDSELALFVRKEDVAKYEGWDMKKIEGLEVYVAGQVKLFRDQLEIVIVGPDQIAETPDDFDLANIPLPETNKKKPTTPKKPGEKKTAKKVPGAIGPSKKDYPDLPLKLEEASVQTVAFYIKGTGMKVKEDPYKLPKDRLACTVASVTAKVEKAEGLGPMQVAFVKPEEDSKDRVQAAIDQLAESYGKWPRDKVVMIDVDFDSRAFKDDPATLVIAALIHSLVTGKEIGSNIVISAEVGAGGATAPAIANEDDFVTGSEIVKSISATLGEARLITADMSTDDLNDVAVDGDWESLANVSVMAAPTLKGGLQLIFANPEGGLGKALAGFDQAQQVIRKSGVGMVKNAQVQQRVMAAGKAWPSHRSAAFYALYGRGKVSRSYSLPKTYAVIRDLHTQLRFIHAGKQNNAKELFKEAGDQMKELRPKLDPDLNKLTRALAGFEREASTAVLRPRSGSGGERQTEKVKSADEEVVKELAALEAKIDGVDFDAEE